MSTPKMWLKITSISLTAVALAGPDKLFAQKDNLRFERISIEQGLSQNTIYCILQDRKSFLWFGTQDGLNKFDGYDFKVHKHDPQDPNSLSNNVVRAIYEDRAGTLWIGTNGGGLNKFDREKEIFTHYRYDPANHNSLSDNKVTPIYEDRSGMLWIGTDGGGLNRFDREKETFKHCKHDPNDSTSLSHDGIWSIYEDSSAMAWHLGRWA